jgi:hypothetical protein
MLKDAFDLAVLARGPAPAVDSSRPPLHVV